MDSSPAVQVPAEWASHTATWLQWPKGQERYLEPTFCQIVQALWQHENVNLVVADQRTHESALRALARAAVQAENTALHTIPTDWCWCRDNGPIFGFVDGALVAMDWAFDAWGDPSSPHRDDDLVPSRIAGALNIPVVSHSIVLEGGAIEHNGAGTVIASRPCLTHRNPRVSSAAIDQSIRQAFGAETVVWLEEYPKDDELTRGHPDGIARFIDVGAVVVGEILDPRDPDRIVFESAAHIIKRAGLRVVRMAIPGRASGLSVNYLNWYVANGVVLVGVFELPAWDRAALDCISTFFPDRQVVGIDVRALWREGGGIHCVTQQEPRPAPPPAR